MKGLVLGSLLCSGLVACASNSTPSMIGNPPRVSLSNQITENDSSERYGACGDRISSSDGLVLDLASEHFNNGRARSALAHLESVTASTADFRLLHADALSATDRLKEANLVYEGLTRSCLSASAYHGLALNAVKATEFDEAGRYMNQARELDPANPDIRNDNGYRLLLEGEYMLAEQEFQTALEIDQSQDQASQNLVLLYFLMGRDDEAVSLARQYRVDAEVVQVLSQSILPTSSTL